jgi:hypothetical protein
MAMATREAVERKLHTSEMRFLVLSKPVLVEARVISNKTRSMR